MTKTKKLTIGLGAFIIMLLSLLFFFFPVNMTTAKAEEQESEGIESIKYTTSIPLYSDGIRESEEDGVRYSVYTSSYVMDSFQYQQMLKEVVADAREPMPAGTLYFCRTTDYEIYIQMKNYQEEYIKTISNGRDFGGNTTISFLDSFSTKIEYAKGYYNNYAGTFSWKTNSSNVKGRYEEWDWSGYQQYTPTFIVSFKETSETVNTTYYYFSFYSRHDLYYDSLHDYTYDDESITAYSNCIEQNTGDWMRSLLLEIPSFPYAGEENLKIYYEMLGQYYEEDAQVKLNYKVFDKNEMAIVDKTLIMPFSSLYRNSPNVLSKELAKQLEGFEYDTILTKEVLPYFDVDLRELTTYVDENGRQFAIISNDMTSLVAEGIEFVDDFTDNNNVVEFNVKYDDFDHSDFYIKLTNNDITNYLELKVNSSDFKIEDNKGVITFDFNLIENQSMVLLNWLFELGIKAEGNSFRVTYQGFEANYERTFDSELREIHTYTVADGGIKVVITDDVNLQVIYELEEDSVYPKYDLFNLGIEIEANIIEDYYVFLEYKYKSFTLKNDEIVVKEVTMQDTTPMLYSSARMFQNVDNLRQYYPEVLTANSLPFEYATLSGVREYDGGNSDVLIEGTNEYYRIYGVEVLYTYNPVFMVVEELPDGNVVRYFNVNKLNSLYTGLDFVENIPSGYCISNIFCETPNVVEISIPSYSVENPTWLDASFYLNVRIDDQVIIKIIVQYSDTFDCVLNYLKKYKETPFGTYQSLTCQIPVSYGKTKSYVKTNSAGTQITLKAPYLASLTKASVESAVGVKIDTLNASVKNIETIWNGSYTRLNVKYSGRTVTQHLPDGSSIIKSIPLTSFGDWCSELGTNWDIMYLNSASGVSGETKYFANADEVYPDDLYGFFSVAAFNKSSSPWRKITDMKLDSDYAVMTYYVDSFHGAELKDISNVLVTDMYGETLDTAKDYVTFFSFINTNYAKDGFVSVDGVVDIRKVPEDSGCGCNGANILDNIGTIILVLVIALAVAIILAVVIKLIKWAKK